MVEKLLDAFLKNQNWAYLWINSPKIYTVCFYGMPNWGLSKYIETNRPLAFITYKAFLKYKKRSGTSLSAPIPAIFEEKYISDYVLLPDQSSLSGCLYFVKF